MPTTSALPYRAVAREGRLRPVPLPIDSPTLLTRRRYGTGSLTGFYRIGTLAPYPTGRVSRPFNGNGSRWPEWPHVNRSDVGTFVGSITGPAPGLEADPDRVKMPIGMGYDYLVTIAHRSTYPTTPQPGMPPADRRMKQRPRNYALPYQIESPQLVNVWPTSSQWVANRMAGTS
jgi:hypothetical protein